MGRTQNFAQVAAYQWIALRQGRQRKRTKRRKALIYKVFGAVLSDAAD
jgi:hypothetical protein